MIPLFKPWIDETEAQRITDALRGRLSGDGPIGQTVERRLEQRLQVERVLLTSSCTHALEVALLALGVGRGDEVICPSFTFASCANAILRTGAVPVFADVEDETLGLDPLDVRRRITSRTRAIMPVHYAGTAVDLDALMEIAKENDL